MSRYSIRLSGPDGWFYALDHFGLKFNTAFYVTTYPDGERLFELFVLGFGVRIGIKPARPSHPPVQPLGDANG